MAHKKEEYTVNIRTLPPGFFATIKAKIGEALGGVLGTVLKYGLILVIAIYAVITALPTLLWLVPVAVVSTFAVVGIYKAYRMPEDEPLPLIKQKAMFMSARILLFLIILIWDIMSVP